MYEVYGWLKCCFRSTETVGLLGTGAQDVHLDFHTAPELRSLWCMQMATTVNKNGWRRREVLHSLRREFVYLLTCGRCSLISETQNEIVVSWSTLWGMMKAYWLDFSLHFWSCCLLRVCRKFGLKLASHYKPVENEVKFGLSEPYSAN